MCRQRAFLPVPETSSVSHKYCTSIDNRFGNDSRGHTARLLFGPTALPWLHQCQCVLHAIQHRHHLYRLGRQEVHRRDPAYRARQGSLQHYLGQGRGLRLRLRRRHRPHLRPPRQGAIHHRLRVQCAPAPPRLEQGRSPLHGHRAHGQQLGRGARHPLPRHAGRRTAAPPGGRERCHDVVERRLRSTELRASPQVTRRLRATTTAFPVHCLVEPRPPYGSRKSRQPQDPDRREYSPVRSSVQRDHRRKEQRRLCVVRSRLQRPDEPEQFPTAMPSRHEQAENSSRRAEAARGARRLPRRQVSSVSAASRVLQHRPW
ncbi:protein TRANSPARENT TESTA GLABRA 1 [Iris pallida]|uniref:Protein TRANSPARENT TESTA GLABRA 1 n=1 Tax=Iris pallida TaxID=29817 RepID=A0AAX6ET18_IRIPA|nr:protein TRANSPARENT TESTA GLABRA 1 [Iris pallida]